MTRHRTLTNQRNRRRSKRTPPCAQDAARTCRRCFHTRIHQGTTRFHDQRLDRLTTSERAIRTLPFQDVHTQYSGARPRLKQTPIERHVFPQTRRRIKPPSNKRPLSKQILRASGSTVYDGWERRHRIRRCTRYRRKTSNARDSDSDQSTTAQCDSVLTRGKPTHRVTILLNRRVATQRASPIGRRRVLLSWGTPRKPAQNRDSPRLQG